MSKKAIEVATRYKRLIDDAEEDIFAAKDIEGIYVIPAYNHAENMIITNNNNIQVARWGLIPFWTKNNVDAGKIWDENRNVNARAETIFDKASFRTPIKKNRCIIPSTGWFEYHYENGKVKDVYYIFLKNMEIFSMAGIYDHWKDDETGEVFMTYSIVTTEANKLMHFIHNGGKNPNRMPVILDRKDEDKWLDPDTTQQELEALMKPYPDKDMHAYPVTRQFNRMNPHDKTIIEDISKQ